MAGGRPLATPFGTVYAPNLTPDAETGLGRWSQAAFARAMRSGVRRDGAHLYPAFPYEHFTRVNAADLGDLYAFLMTRAPVSARAPANRLIPPLGFRPLLAGWKLLFLRRRPVPGDPAKSSEWNRGAYLSEGLGHCGACHTPRNLLGAEEHGRAYAGGVAEGWRAPALDRSNPARRAWSVEALERYLRTGISPDHGAAGGPMAAVTQDLAAVPQADVHAIAVYFASRMGSSASVGAAAIDKPEVAGSANPQGAPLFAGACAVCHGLGAPMLSQGRPSLDLATAVTDGEPTSAIQAVLQGVSPPAAGRGPLMPAYADELTDAQVAQVLAYSRARFSDRPPWPNLEKAVRQGRKEGAKP